ncbi:MAG: SDR family NAD(P)-dependent oxidoreductase, partial [Verrucomicrobia bacterium]|nr:SDR family NAD(P)-dependent oxidoreductase [Verrucomicrobiota bacterium]
MNQLDLNGKNAIVTGGARGIGYAIATRLIASGARVCLWDRDAAALAEASKKLSTDGNVHTVTLDLTKPDEVKAAAAETRRHFGSIEILVNNAGIAGVNKRTWEFTPDEWRVVIETNLNA